MIYLMDDRYLTNKKLVINDKEILFGMEMYPVANILRGKKLHQKYCFLWWNSMIENHYNTPQVVNVKMQTHLVRD